MTRVPEDPPPFEPFPLEGSERVYDSYWCGLRKDLIRLPNGELQDYHVFEIAPAVVVVPVLPDGSIVFLWQFRHPHGGTHWEVPAGRIDDGEEPDQAAERELLEETGCRTERLERITGFYPTNGISPHHAHVYVALDCERLVETSHDASERMTVHVLPEDEVRARLVRGDFVDGFTSLALFHHFARRDAEAAT